MRPAASILGGRAGAMWWTHAHSGPVDGREVMEGRTGDGGWGGVWRVTPCSPIACTSSREERREAPPPSQRPPVRSSPYRTISGPHAVCRILVFLARIRTRRTGGGRGRPVVVGTACARPAEGAGRPRNLGQRAGGREAWAVERSSGLTAAIGRRRPGSAPGARKRQEAQRARQTAQPPSPRDRQERAPEDSSAGGVPYAPATMCCPRQLV